LVAFTLPARADAPDSRDAVEAAVEGRDLRTSLSSVTAVNGIANADGARLCDGSLRAIRIRQRHEDHRRPASTLRQHLLDVRG
jgi:hypothetical protein